LVRLREEISDMFDRFFGRLPAWSDIGVWPEFSRGDWMRFRGPEVEVTDKEILVRAEVPGFEPGDFDIQVSGNILTISAEHNKETEETKEEGFRSWERRYRQFRQSITLPAAVNADKVEAQYKAGVLELRLPRLEEAQRKKIEIKG